jgi:hypothetical protein
MEAVFDPRTSNASWKKSPDSLRDVIVGCLATPKFLSGTETCRPIYLKCWSIGQNGHEGHFSPEGARQRHCAYVTCIFSLKAKKFAWNLVHKIALKCLITTNARCGMCCMCVNECSSRFHLGSMLWSQFSAIRGNFRPKNWHFSQKPMLWSNFCSIKICF